MKFVKQKGISLKVRGRPVTLEYREARDGRRAMLVLNRLPLEEGPPGRIRRRYNHLVKEQYRQLGQEAPAAGLMRPERGAGGGALRATTDADGCPVWRR